MKKIFYTIVTLNLLFFMTALEVTYSDDVVETVSAEGIKKFIKSYIENETTLKGGYFLLFDKVKNEVLQLNLSKINDRVNLVIKDEVFCGKYRTRHFWIASCNFESANGKSNYELDFWIKNKNANGDFEVFIIAIHKVDGKERFAYNKNEIKPLK